VSAAAAVDSALEFAERSPETTRTRTLTWQDPLAAAAAGTELSGIEYMLAILDGKIPPPPIAVTLRMAVVDIGDGEATFEGLPGEEHFNPIGVVHGGYAATLLDSAMGCAVHTTLPAGVGYTTLTLETKFMRPIGRDTGVVRAEAKVVHRGRRQVTTEGRLVAGDRGKLLAHGTGTCLILGS
jgi:uncharacterized protein (TIGR00369 family)